jgi:hypothetical protein
LSLLVWCLVFVRQAAARAELGRNVAELCRRLRKRFGAFVFRDLFEEDGVVRCCGAEGHPARPVGDWPSVPDC